MPAIEQGKSELQFPASAVLKIGTLGVAPARALPVQLICEASREREKVLMVPLPGVVPEAGVVGFRLTPPLLMKSRMLGCSKIMAPPARRTVLPVPKTSHANPIRGEMAFFSIG